MTTVFALIVIALGLICWIGQTLVLFTPDIAVKLGVGEAEEDIDRSMYLFERFSQGIMDILLTWMLPVAALMMLLGIKQWAVLALVGAGVYLYFPGVFVITRVVLKRDGRKVGNPASELTAYVLGALWFLSAIGMIYLALLELSTKG